jgi:uncharacterized protein involved in response to NO
MSATPVDRLRQRNADLPALFSYGFRPFFLGGALTAALAVPLWLAMLATGLEPAGPFSALIWHAHEMIFGYLAAVVAGFVLTAVPNWTGRLPVTGWSLIGLFSLWVAGRIACVGLPWPVAAAVVDMAFLVTLAGVVWREIAAGRHLGSLPVAALISLLALANLVFHLQAQWPGLAGYGERMALGGAALLISLIGGRITPSFTRNWLAKAGLSPLPTPFGRFDKVTIALTVAAVALWVGFPEGLVTGVVLALAGALHLVRVARWRGLSARREPIVLIMHLGYFWLAVSLLLMGLAAYDPASLSGTAALHALSAGAVGTMTLAVMTRASLGHTGRPIATSAATFTIYVLVTLGAILRVAAPFVGDLYLATLFAGGMLWSGAFGLFVLAYAPVLLRPGLGRT